MTLRDDQEDALQALREAVGAGKRRIMMQAPTGYGKTMLAAALVNNARAKQKKILFTVPAISLIDQTVDMFAKQKIWDVGVIQATHHQTDWTQPIQVCSIQTLMKRTLPQADVVLLDEAHRWFRFYERWLSKDKMPEWGNVPFIGLSATPWTVGLGAWFDHFHKAATIRQMIDAGFLSDFKVYAPSHPDLTGVRIVNGDYHEQELSEKMQPLIGDAVDTWVRLGERRPTLCYAVDRAHAKKLQEQFIAAGVRCGYLDFNHDDATKRSRKTGAVIEGRGEIKRKFHSGEYEVVVNVETLTTGVDWDVRCIVLCRPTRSDMLFTQIIGRGLRTAPEGSAPKDHCLILDHSDNHSRLGFVTDIDESYTGLHDGKAPRHDNRTMMIRLPKECPQCSYLRPPKMAKCPACGFTSIVVSKIEPRAGELRELKPRPKTPMSDGSLLTHNERAMFFAELKGYAFQHNYKDGWAANKYRERIGVWPAHDMKHVPMLSPKPSTASWIKSRAIAWAKSKAKRAWDDDNVRG